MNQNQSSTMRNKRHHSFREPRSSNRMTNDEIRRNTEIRRTNGIAHQSALWHSGFGFLSSLVIRHSSFHNRFMVSMRARKRKGAFHEPTLVWSPAFRRLRVARPAEAGTPCGRQFTVPMHGNTERAGRFCLGAITWLFTLLFIAGGTGQTRGAEGQLPNTLDLLEGRRRQQVAAAQKAQVFHGFQ